jgi:hypothetical protein
LVCHYSVNFVLRSTLPTIKLALLPESMANKFIKT